MFQDSLYFWSNCYYNIWSAAGQTYITPNNSKTGDVNREQLLKNLNGFGVYVSLSYSPPYIVKKYTILCCFAINLLKVNSIWELLELNNP